MIISSSEIFRKKSSDKKCQSYDLKEIFAKSNAHSQEQNFEGVKRRQNLSKQEHKVFYRCSLPSSLQKRSKDYNGLANGHLNEVLMLNQPFCLGHFVFYSVC